METMIRNSRTASLLNGRILCIVIFLACAGYLQTAGANEQGGTSKLAEEIFEATDIRGGLAVHVGCGDGHLTAALRANDSFIVQGLDADAKNIEAARNHIRSLGSYGRISVRTWGRNWLPFGDNLVNLLVANSDCRIPREEIDRVLAPNGAAVMLDADLSIAESFRKGVPEDIDEWTHYLHDAGNNAVAEDDRVGPPKHLQWKSGPMWCRSHEFSSSVQALISANGRLIGVIDEGIIGQPRGVPTFWALIARDAFNGILLWRLPCDRINPHALTAIEDKVYVTLRNRGPLSILDAATGKILHTCNWTGKVSEIAFCDNRLVLNTQLTGKKEKSGPHMVAADPDNGEILWSKRAKATAKNTMVAGSGRVCYVDSNDLICRSLEDGEEMWRTDVKNRKNRYAVLYNDAVFLTGGSTRAFSLETGKLLWTGPDGNPHARNPPGLFGAGDLIWTAWDHVDPRSFLWQHREEVRKGYDPLTGEVQKTITARRLVTAGHHIRCYPPKATKRYLLLNKRGVEFFDLEGSNHMRANWTRGACGFGMLPANGLLYTPPSQCFCYQGVLLAGLNALSAERQIPSSEAAKRRQGGRLQRGPAYDRISKMKSAKKDRAQWPTYRHDNLRGGSIDATLPVELDRIWEISLCDPAFPPQAADEAPPVLREYPKGGLTPPVAADGRVVVAEPDAHMVHAVSTEDGKFLWSFVADGRVDSPPTLYKGLCIFGGTDGYVYCLTAKDGRLAWRFRAAPEQRDICVMGQVESAWPVHGSVLVRDGKVYLTAGRSSYLDGGIRLYALNPLTGEVLHQTTLQSSEPDTSEYGGRPFDMEGARSDILVAGKEDIYLFQNRFDASLTPRAMPRITKLGDRQGEPHLITTDGFLDKTWFNRTCWTY
ncbi:MAG: outer membrane protein assembly factor BamB family protein, partial [Planctomycetota bacterium]